MSKQVGKALFQELSKHHSFAKKLQQEVVRRTELAKQTQAKRSGEVTPAAVKEYEVKPLDPKIVDNFKLHQLRDQDVSEIVDYLKHQRQYKELLAKYSSGPEDTIERVNATARRVGLDASEL